MSNEIAQFDPNALAHKDAGIYGLPFTTATAKQIILPVPWEVTVSYRTGTAHGPSAIFAAAAQVDLYDPDVPDAWKAGLAMEEIPERLVGLNDSLREKAERYLELLAAGETPEKQKEMRELLKEIESGCETMNGWVQERAAHFLDQGKVVSLIGGDHSSPLGLFRELGKRYPEFGILHFDAHSDLRDAYEGFKYSHASIMFNALDIKSMKKLVQVGIRDYCEEEAQLIKDSHGRIIAFYDRDLQNRLFDGNSWREICDEIVAQLPQNVYVSFDVDGLDPKLCPNTGTPVPGGLEFEQALYLVRRVSRSGRKLIGFDVNEVAPGEEDEWDANVGARLVWRLANLVALSQNLVPS